MKKITGIGVLLLLISLSVFAYSGNEKSEKEGNVVEVQKDGDFYVEADRDKDGNIDYVLRYDEWGVKISEEIDFNYDGVMDDFYYYSSGVLQLREIDTNYDEKIDVWVYIRKGVYIERYERDLDFDGKIDQVKDFSENSAAAEAG